MRWLGWGGGCLSLAMASLNAAESRAMALGTRHANLEPFRSGIFPQDASRGIETSHEGRNHPRRKSGYLHALVEEIVVAGDTATMKGSYETLAKAISEKKKGTSVEVPSSIIAWRA